MSEEKLITSSRHILPFKNLSSDDFERLCYWIVERSGEYDAVEHYGMTGDKKRDVVGYKHSTTSTREQWYFQCKRYKSISFYAFEIELNSIKGHSDENRDFKPDNIVFVTACPVSPSCKDDVKKLSKKLGLGSVYFWTDVEVDEKAKGTDGIVDEFFNGGINVSSLVEDISELTAEKFNKLLQPDFLPTSQISQADPSRVDKINREIDKSVESIRSNDFMKAKEQLFVTLGKIQDNSTNYSKELARVYNNLGVCFNSSSSEGGDYDEAERYFELSLDSVPNFEKAKLNLTSVYLSKGGKKDIEKAFNISQELWKSSENKDPIALTSLVWSIYYKDSAQKAVDFYEKTDDAKKLVLGSDVLQNLMGNMYLAVNDFEKAEQIVKLALDFSPSAPQHLSLMASILIGKSQKEHALPLSLEMVPKFRDYQDIRRALGLLNEALSGVAEANGKFLEDRIKVDILICMLWLRRANEANYRDVRKSIDITCLNEDQKQQLLMQDLAVELETRNFENAYRLLIASPEWSEKVDYNEKMRVAGIFFYKGAIEQSKSILSGLEEEAFKKEDINYCIAVSQNEILLGNKSLAISAAQKSKEFSKDTESEAKILSNYNGLMYRYAYSGETDRLMTGIADYAERFPEQEIFKSFQAIDDEGKPTEEIMEIFQKRKEYYESVRQSIVSQAVPSYSLEKVFNKTFAEILSYQDDPDLNLKLCTPDITVKDELLQNISEGEGFVLDYASLLNISKMNLLGHLSKLGKTLYITDKLFVKIQSELLMFEHEDLRRLWGFIRTSQEIVITEEEANLEDGRIVDLLDDWLVETLKLAKAKNAVLFLDDWYILRCLSIDKIKGSNSLALIKFMLSEGWIDEKVYSTSLGDLAERFYVFLDFTSSDLFQIAMEDNCKVTLRSQHLVNQFSEPGSDLKSFMNVFIGFIDLFWKTGALPEDKLRWLRFFTDRITEFIDKQGGAQSEDELNSVIPGFTGIWVIAIKRSNKDELALIGSKVDDIISKEYLVGFKKEVKTLLNVRKDKLTNKD